MKNFFNSKHLLLIVLALTTLTASQCQNGQLPFDSACVPIQYQEGCARYTRDNQCAQCQYGYTLTGSKCQATTQNQDCCGAYDQEGVCTQCEAGLYYSAPFCLRQNIPGCLVKQGNTCAVCGQGFFPNQGRCLTAISNCQNYKPDGQCTACKPGFRLSRGYCVEQASTSNCQLQNEFGCFQCKESFYLTANRTCLQFEAGCLQYWRQKCQVCVPPFELTSAGKCQIFACQSYSAQGCSQCHNGWTLQNGICHNGNCIRTANNKCTQCRSGFRLGAQGCIRETAVFQCTGCAPGYRFQSGRCVLNIFGCVQYTQDGKCKVCRDNFERTITGECQILGCEKYDQNGCVKCLAPFTFDNGKCLISFCTRYGLSGCAQCSDGYLLSRGICVIRDPFCQQYSADNSTCQTCVPRYFLRGGRCTQRLRGCVYNANGDCQCAQGFFRDQSGACVIIGCSSYDSSDRCTACRDPFSFNSRDGTCVIQFCTRYDLSGCVQCQNGCALINGRCQVSDQYCLTVDSAGRCQRCQTGFSIQESSGRCFRVIQNCASFDNDQVTCTRCRDGFLLVDNACRQRIANCQTQTLKPFECTLCVSGFHLENGQCARNNPFCARYKKVDNDETCQACVEGYFLSGGQCFKQAFGCVYRGDRCISCTRPFFFISQNSSCVIPGCRTYRQNGCRECNAPFRVADNTCVIDNCVGYNVDGCQSCKTGFQVANRVCVQTDPNCQTLNNGACTKCRTGFALIRGKCVAGDVNCQSYRDDGSCFKCRNTHFLDNNRRCQIKENGCVYTNNRCAYCIPPFLFDEKTSTCRIDFCDKTDQTGCVSCRSPFELSKDKSCEITFCANVNNGACYQCRAGYHVKGGRCIIDHPDCRSYDQDGDCQVCRQGLVLTSNGQCASTNTACIQAASNDRTKCLACGQGFFLNRFFICQKMDGKCAAYTNGVCSKCTQKFFLWSDICFPYSPGCVQYSGKDCTFCRKGFTLKNGECFKWKDEDFGLLGIDDYYNFTITPIDVRQSKYYIDNLSPATAIGSFFFSSFFDNSYRDASLSVDDEVIGKGWRSQFQDDNSFIGVEITGDPVTFYALQIENIESYQIKQFYLEYSVDGISFIKVETPFTVASTQQTGITTIYFTGIYAKSIRIRVNSYQGWPACRIQFFYYDLIRFKKISNLKSLRYLQETISSNFVDRVDNQLFINQAYFFNPTASCSNKDMCFTGLQLCKPHTITQLVLQVENGSLSEFYLTFSVDGRSYNCFQGCQKIKVGALTNKEFSYKFAVGLQAQGIRIYPSKYEGSLLRLSPTFFYK